MNLGQGRILLDIRLISLLNVFSGLRKKTCAPGASGLDEHQKTPGHTDLFGQSDAIVKHVLEVLMIVKYVTYNLFASL